MDGQLKFLIPFLLLSCSLSAQMVQSISNAQKVPDPGTIVFTPSAGAVANPTTVTFSGAHAGSIYCSTQDGSTPTTNLLGTACTHGSLGSTTSITTAVTVKVVSGLLGDLDSPVASAAYTISGGSATVALLQHPSVHCTGSFTTCSLTLTQGITAGSFLVFGGDTDSGHTGASISSINVGGTFAACSGCHVIGTAMPTIGGWVLSSTSTAGPIVITYSQSINGSYIEMREYSCSGGTVSHDIDNTADNGTDTTPYAGVPFTGGSAPTGTNDVIVQWSDGFGTDPTSISAPYGNFDNLAGAGIGMAESLNTTSGTAPNWTAAGNTGGKTAAAIAMKCQ